MGSPKHLWSGDWERESESAAQERARRLAPTRQPVDPPAPRITRPPGPSPYARAMTALRRMRTDLGALLWSAVTGLAGLRISRARMRVALVLALAALLVAGSAYGLSALGGSGASGAASRQVAWIGLQMESLSPSAVVIAAVDRGGPAAGAGLRTGDVITQIDGRPVVTPIDVTEDVQARSPGQSVEIQIARGSATYTVQVTLQGRPVGSP